MATADVDRLRIVNRFANRITDVTCLGFPDRLADGVADVLGLGFPDRLADGVAARLGFPDRLADGVADVLGLGFPDRLADGVGAGTVFCLINRFAHGVTAFPVPCFRNVFHAINGLGFPDRLVACFVAGVLLFFVDNLFTGLHDGMALLFAAAIVDSAATGPTAFHPCGTAIAPIGTRYYEHGQQSGHARYC
jgi:hypothetical protein